MINQREKKKMGKARAEKFTTSWKEYKQFCDWDDEKPNWFKHIGYNIIGIIEYHSIICRIFGHRWESQGADAENGQEFIYCIKCGQSFTAQF